MVTRIDECVHDEQLTYQIIPKEDHMKNNILSYKITKAFLDSEIELLNAYYKKIRKNDHGKFISQTIKNTRFADKLITRFKLPKSFTKETKYTYKNSMTKIIDIETTNSLCDYPLDKIFDRTSIKNSIKISNESFSNDKSLYCIIPISSDELLNVWLDDNQLDSIKASVGDMYICENAADITFVRSTIRNEILPIRYIIVIKLFYE